MTTARTGGSNGDLEIVRRDLYPIERLDSPEGQALVASCRAQIDSQGYCILPDFVAPDALAQMTGESDAVAPSAYVSRIKTNVYFSADDESLPADHPKRIFMERSSAFVPADCIPADSMLRRLYDWPPFTAFIAAAMDESVLYKYADPVADMPLNVVGPGEQFPWHFDTNEFSVTILTQAAETGGLFEYARDIRSAEAENYPAVARVLAGERDLVRSLEIRPGDLQIFKGRHSLHRVTRVGGTRPRYTVIFSFAREPGMVGRIARTRQLYGKVLPVHHEAERAGDRSDRLED